MAERPPLTVLPRTSSPLRPRHPGEATQGRRQPGASLLILLLFLGLATSAEARRERLELRHTRLDLPGAPSAVLPADLDGDGHRDLVVFIAYTEWDQLMVEESTEMAGIDGLVEVLTIVPALADRRELRLYLADPDSPGHFLPVEHVLPVGKEVLALESGPPETPVLALTDAGLSALRFDRDTRQLGFESLFERRPVLAGSGTFLPRPNLAHDFDGDGRSDLLFPADDGAAIYLSRGAGPTTLASLVPLPTDEHRTDPYGGRALRLYPLPRVEDVTGDQRPDLIFPAHDDLWDGFYVARSLGDGRFAAAEGPFSMANPCKAEKADEPPPTNEGRGVTVRVEVDREDDDDNSGNSASNEEEEESCDGWPSLAFFGDLDGDGRAEYVTQEGFGLDEDAGMREEVKEAKRPPHRYRLYRSDDDLEPTADPYGTFDAIGYTFDTSGEGGDEGISIPGGFQDLDGDGRRDLIALTLDFSVFQIMRVMATHTFSLGLDFHLYCQTETGDFRPVPGLDLSGKFKIHLDDVRLSQLSLFDGDFDGDGRADFVQLGRGRKVTIHRGREGCAYASRPDLQIELEEEPRNLSLVRIEDVDGDGLSDLYVVQPNRKRKRSEIEPGVTAAVRLDLYLSGRAAAESLARATTATGARTAEGVSP